MARAKLQIVWSADADNDLLQIWGYFADKASPATADDQILKIEQACSVLSDWPLSGRSRDAIIQGMRSIVATPHVIFYRVAGDVVQIVRVLHGHRDIDAIFAEMP